MFRERIPPQSEVVRVIVLKDSPCCGLAHRLRRDGPIPAVELGLGLGRRPALLLPCRHGRHRLRLVQQLEPSGFPRLHQLSVVGLSPVVQPERDQTRVVLCVHPAALRPAHEGDVLALSLHPIADDDLALKLDLVLALLLGQQPLVPEHQLSLPGEPTVRVEQLPRRALPLLGVSIVRIRGLPHHRGFAHHDAAALLDPPQRHEAEVGLCWLGLRRDRHDLLDDLEVGQLEGAPRALARLDVLLFLEVPQVDFAQHEPAQRRRSLLGIGSLGECGKAVAGQCKSKVRQ